ncbi:MAG TPA: cytochrome c-type biogenesis protein CcmH [Actinomycetota bacterium]|nr:cytochrome c-type biogenesis protein CcmH [Actinomycetota bacterium]
MRRVSASRSTRSVADGLALAALLGGLLLFALVPRPASGMPMRAPLPQVGTGSDMAPHAPVEVPVSPELKQVLETLLCQCGCNLDAYQCQQTMTCDVSTAMWDQAALMVDRRGKTPEQALQAFAADYGEYVLAEPIKRGFNLVAWVLPFAVLAVGGMAIAVALRRWRPRGQSPVADVATSIDPRYLDRLERELREEG